MAKCLELERASIGQAIDRLEELRCVERRVAENDRRVWEVHLLPAAIELLPALRSEADSLYAKMLNNVSVKQLDALAATLTALRDNPGERQ